MADDIISDVEGMIKNGQYPQALDSCDGIIGTFGIFKDRDAKLAVSNAMTLLGVALGLQTVQKQKNMLLHDQNEVDNLWKPVFSCLNEAIAYQTAIDHMLGLIKTRAHIAVFRLQKGEKLESVLPEIQKIVNLIRAEKLNAQSEEVVVELKNIEVILVRLNPHNIQGLNIEVMMTK